MNKNAPNPDHAALVDDLANMLETFGNVATTLESAATMFNRATRGTLDRTKAASARDLCRQEAAAIEQMAPSLIALTSAIRDALVETSGEETWLIPSR